VDLPFLDGYDLRATPLVERKRALAALFAGAGRAPSLRFADHVVGQGAETFAAACGLGARGIVSKRADAAYGTSTKKTAKTSAARVVRCPAGAGPKEGAAESAPEAKRKTRRRADETATEKAK